MNSSTDADLIQSLNYISEQLNRCISPFIFIFGVAGNILNCLVLSRRNLRSNPCALLFLISSFIDLISLLAGLPTRILAGWELDPTTAYHSICKLRAFMVFSTRTAAIWLIVLATIDRWLLSSIDIHRRQMSSLKNVRRATVIVCILSIVAYAQMLYCYEANITDAPLKCYGKTHACRLATDLIYTFVTIAIPLILMITFGLLTFSNVRQVHNRVQHHENDIHVRTDGHHDGHTDLHARKTDHHLLRMLLLQVLLLILVCIPQAIQKIHISIQPFGSGSQLDDVIKTFLYNIELLLAFIASSMPFYVYTLAGGSIFRKTFIDLMRSIIQKITHPNS